MEIENASTTPSESNYIRNVNTVRWESRKYRHFYKWKLTKGNPKYCGWLNFREVPIFVVFVEGPVHEFKYQLISDFLCE